MKTNQITVVRLVGLCILGDISEEFLVLYSITTHSVSYLGKCMTNLKLDHYKADQLSEN